MKEQKRKMQAFVFQYPLPEIVLPILNFNLVFQCLEAANVQILSDLQIREKFLNGNVNQKNFYPRNTMQDHRAHLMSQMISGSLVGFSIQKFSSELCLPLPNDDALLRNACCKFQRDPQSSTLCMLQLHFCITTLSYIINHMCQAK